MSNLLRHDGHEIRAAEIMSGILSSPHLPLIRSYLLYSGTWGHLTWLGTPLTRNRQNFPFNAEKKDFERGAERLAL
jgi:hypothetical protein